MNLIQFFERVAGVLRKSGVDYALAGGLVASVYRDRERTTNDLDFLIYAGAKTEETAFSIIEQFELTPHIVRKADLEGGPMFAIKRKTTPPCVIAGRPGKNDRRLGLDFILPAMPWFEEAIKRAKYNKVDFGFGGIPCLTKEDVVISKFYSLRNDKSRFNDLDDLKSIFQTGCEMDIPYICGQMQRLKLPIPDVLKDIVPRPLWLTSKKILRS